MSTTSNEETVDLNSFAQMAGFPVELIKKELFNGNDGSETVTLESLRSAMLSYLDKTMLEE